VTDAEPIAARTRLIDPLALALLVVALILPWLGATELSGTDEARYTQVAREMRLSGRWFSPLLNSEDYWEKPALFFDLLQVPQLLAGRVTPLGSRLVILPFAIAAVLVTFVAGRTLAGRRAGLLAGAILATSALFAELAGTAVLDMPMLVFTTLALAFHVLATRTERSPARYHLAAAIAMGIGCLFKGPVAILVPGAVMAADSVARGGLSAARTSKLLWIPLVALLVLGLWVVPMTFIHGQEFADHMIGKHVVGRSVGAAAPHAKGALFYLPRILLAWFPWTLALPAAIAGWRCAAPPAARLADPRDALRFARIWALGVPLLLALLASKRSQYLLPAIPGFALWMGIWLDARWRAGGAFVPGERRALRITGGFLAALAPAIAFALPPLIGLAELRGTWGMLGAGLPSAFWLAARGSAALAIGAGAAILLGAAAVALSRPTPRRVTIGLLALGIGAIGLRHGIGDPLIDRTERVNEFGAELRGFLDAGGQVGFYGMRLDGAYLLHSGATHFDPLDDPGEVAAHLDAPEARGVLGKSRYFRRDGIREHACGAVVLFRHGEGRGEVVLLGNARAEALLRGGPAAPER